MIEGIQIKVCGLTSLADSEYAGASGADHLGFILHPKSPRYISLAQFRSIAGRLPKKYKVAVVVEPEAESLVAMRDAGFDRFQVHFRHDLPLGTIESWSEALGVQDLWLAPKLPPSLDVPDAWTGLSNTILLDTFDPHLFGGTGRTGDWPKFRRHREGNPGKTWILSGGLNPENVGDALSGSGALFVDVNSGVESSPGIKDNAKLAAFAAAVRAATGRTA
jgi:phosphoribosylanthranilate isomerase